MITLIISNKEMEDIMKIVKTLEESGLLIREKIENKANETTGGSLGISLGILGASLLGRLLAGKGVIRACQRGIEAGQDL